VILILKNIVERGRARDNMVLVYCMLYT